jgi:signal peptidase I
MVLTGFMLRETTASGYIVEQHSMEQTLIEGDALLTNSLADPKRGDIVVTDGWGSGNNYVKRVIGIPGDQVDYVNGELVLNGIFTEEPYAINENDDYSVVVPEGMYWVLGDNRPESSDSREHGFVSAEDIKGVAYFRYWPLNRFGTVGGY